MSRPAYARSLLAFLRTQQPASLRPAHIDRVQIGSGQAVFQIEYSAPSPFGLIGP